MLKIALIIGTGGFVGTVSRYITYKIVESNFASDFPLGTFIVNIIGCLTIGILYGITERGNAITEEWRLFLTVGFCGGFTTFSAFANENFLMLKETEFLLAIMYAGVSILLGIGAVYIGNLATKLF